MTLGRQVGLIVVAVATAMALAVPALHRREARPDEGRRAVLLMLSSYLEGLLLIQMDG